jgi:hypothetical protein
MMATSLPQLEAWTFSSPSPGTPARMTAGSSSTTRGSPGGRHPPAHHHHPRRGQRHPPIILFGTPQPIPQWNHPALSFSFVGTTTIPTSATRLWAKPGKKNDDDDDDDWEPDEEELLSELEELGDLDVVEDDLNEGLEDPDEVQEEEEEDADDELDAEDDDVDGPVRKRRVRNASDDDDEDDFQVDNDDDIWADAEEEEEDGGWDEADEYEYLYEDGSDVDGEDDGKDEEALRELLNDPDFEDIPLEDDPTDPTYTEKLKLVQETVDRRIAVAADENFDALDYIRNRMSDEEKKVMDSFVVNQDAEKEADEYIDSVINVSEVENMDIDAHLAKTTDLYDDDPYERTGVSNFAGTGVTDDDIAALDQAWKETNAALAAEPWNKVDEKERHFDFEGLDDATKEELMEADYEIGGSPYNHTKWLIYDLDFNVSNLLLAACKHNPNAPVILNHWLPQLEIYERYRHVRERGFDFTWEDVEKADMEELKRYYMGFGYDEIPEKAPAETGLIGFGELDEEELKMASFEKWMLEVYNEEWDRKDFDDEKIVDEDNVFSENFVMPQHPDLPTLEETQEDLARWNSEIQNDHYDVIKEGGEAAEEILKYRDMMGQNVEYKPTDDKDFQENFRGHLVIACGDFDSDLDMAEAITTRFEKEFGNQVYVETKIMMHVREDDYVFEVWLESYEIELIHSRRRSFLGTDGWTGPGDVDAKQLDYLVEQVRLLISDDARYSYAVTQLDMQAN